MDMYVDSYKLIYRIETKLIQSNHVPGTRLELVTLGFSVLCFTS